MSWESFNKSIEADRKRYVKNVWQACAFVVDKARDDAPKGWSLQLSRSGINALKPVMNGKWIIGIITASAISASGYDYAEIQHDEELRHASLQPLQRGYTDFGSGGTQKQRYRQGYEIMKASSPKYATEFLSRQFVVHEERIRSLLRK